ncbi:S10 family serine carboxypeptidase-like protein [Labrys okinawensis]|uniref:S10 family serine carboxypeptidase-like protein n=1 Tax=Labrys okinawensis TaxID=346911 RepID=UPI0039BC86F8
MLIAASNQEAVPTDIPVLDTTPYGAGPDDNVTDTSENAAITHHSATIGGKTIAYTARAGHLVAVDPSSSKPNAKFFYVSFTEDGADPSTRPVTFFYNGGPGSSAVFLLLGSYSPRRIHTDMPGFTPPPPYRMEDNPDSLLDRTDLVYINPIGTGYSAAIAPAKNRDFWGVDQDARSIKQFIKRYLTAFGRWNSPRFLFGESYGTARSCVLAWMLHEDGIDLNGIVLQSSVLDYPPTFSNPVGLLPTFAADAWWHKKTTVSPPPTDLPSFMTQVIAFAQGPYAKALAAFPKSDPATTQTLGEMLGISPVVLDSWALNVEANNGITSSFLVALLQNQGLALGIYDGRVTAIDTGIAAIVDPASGSNDPTMAAVSGVYTSMWNVYLNNDLQFTSTSNFVDLNDQAYANWDFSHIDPTGSQKGGKDASGNPIVYTAGDLAAAMAANPDLKVFSANGYFDGVTPFFQTKLTLDAMPLVDSKARANLTIRNYASGHMIYLDGASRTQMKADLTALYDGVIMQFAMRARFASLLAASRQAARQHLRPYFKRPGQGKGKLTLRVAPNAAPWTLPDRCRAYSWPSGLRGGGVIAIIELDGGYVTSDIEAFFQSIGKPSPTLKDVVISGPGNSPGRHEGDEADPDTEVTMDIEIAAAAYTLATGQPASIRVYWADGTDMGSIAAAISAASADGCDVCSISWGSDEANWQAAGQQAGVDYAANLNAAAKAASSGGMIVFAASGDNDSSDGGATPANVDLPSSSPYVIGCGGTTKTPQAETVWNNDPGSPEGNGTGGGFSTIFPSQPWQAGAPQGPGRMVPDVAGNADPFTGYQLVIHGASVPLGGTSAVAPLYAGLFASFGARLGLVTPKLWLNQTCFSDIVSGDNGFYRARIGPDPCTGLGAPIGDRLANLFGAVPAPAEIVAAAGAEPALARAPLQRSAPRPGKRA